MRRFALMLVLTAAFLPVSAQSKIAERISTLDQRTNLNVTVYNCGMALVHDRRKIALQSGLNHIAWRDVSAQMDATSAVLAPVDSGDRVDVVEQNFDYDLLNPQALQEKYVGKYVTVVHPARFPGDKERRERAKLLSIDGGIMLQYAGGIETDLRGGYMIYPVVPKDFRDRPTLVLDLDSDAAADPLLDLSYMTNGISWRADYVAVLARDESSLSLRGVVTLSNTSGEPYDDAHLQLIAGNVQCQAPQAQNSYALKTIARVMSRAAADNLSQEDYFEYHLYTLGRSTSILQDQTKQITLLSAQNVPVRKTLELRGSSEYYENQSQNADLGDRLPVGVYVTFVNRGGDLGVPLPAGPMRLYEKDSRGLPQFLGADSIDHTPKNESVRLHLGDSFDVTARKKQTDFRFADSCHTRSSYQIVVSNAKQITQQVLIVEPIPGEWRILDESAPHVKSSSSTANWTLDVPAGGRKELDYTADVRWCW
jgi:hypothetical protein